MTTRLLVLFLLGIGPADWAVGQNESANPWPGFEVSPRFEEQVREIRLASGVRVIIVAPATSSFAKDRPTQLVIYATPNGNTAEQTLGCGKAEGRDWHYYIQHVAAQVRQFRSEHEDQNVVLACLQPDNRSWPTWRKRRENSDVQFKSIVEALVLRLPSDDVHVTLTGHSGGGSFMFGFINAVEKIPAIVERIAFLDANYGYSNDQRHGEKFVAWLKGNAARQLVIVAYDDRNIMLNGKRVVSETGGTFRASHRFIDWLRNRQEMQSSKQGEFDTYQTITGKTKILIHPNPDNKILHTRLVGDMNGLHYSMSLGVDSEGKTVRLGRPVTYSEWIQPQPFQPAHWQTTVPAIRHRSIEALSGSELVENLADTTVEQREQAIATELLRGNVPEHLRKFVPVTIQSETPDGVKHELTLLVLPDYLAVGSSADHLRVPLTPQTAQRIADFYGCTLPTRKMVDAIHHEAQQKIEPRPLTEDRETLRTFFQHHRIVENQLEGYTPGDLVSGIKKDVVLTNRFKAKQGRVAIYGWHKLDGEPIQPLSTVHTETYVDYSHGIRLVCQWANVDGKLILLRDLLKDEHLCSLVSDEGPIDAEIYDRLQSGAAPK